MRAAVLHDVARMAIRDVARRPRARATSSCASTAVGPLRHRLPHLRRPRQLSHRSARPPHPARRASPQILGHEVAGKVIDVGPRRARCSRPAIASCSIRAATARAAGASRTASTARAGDSHQCEHYGEHGITGLPGGLARLPRRARGATRVRVGAATSLPDDRGGADRAAGVHHPCDGRRRRGAQPRYDARRTGGGAARGPCSWPAPGRPGCCSSSTCATWSASRAAARQRARRGKRALAACSSAPRPIDPRATGTGRRGAGRARTAARAEWLIDASGLGAGVRRSAGPDRASRPRSCSTAHGQAGVDISVLSNIQFREPRWSRRSAPRADSTRTAVRSSIGGARPARGGARRVGAVHHAPLSLARRRSRAPSAARIASPATSKASSSLKPGRVHGPAEVGRIRQRRRWAARRLTP